MRTQAKVRHDIIRHKSVSLYSCENDEKARRYLFSRIFFPRNILRSNSGTFDCIEEIIFRVLFLFKIVLFLRKFYNFFLLQQSIQNCFQSRFLSAECRWGQFFQWNFYDSCVGGKKSGNIWMAISWLLVN